MGFFASLCPLLSAQYLAEINYDNPGNDYNEYIEVFVPTGTNAADLDVVLYNGATGNTYNTTTVSSGSSNSVTGGTLYLLTYPSNGIQNGAPDGVALVNNATNTVIAFISYEGSFTANNGPANGMTSTDVGVSESGSSPDQSMQDEDGDGTWVIGPPSKGVLPIELVSFLVNKRDNKVVITWRTATEINNDYFTVERSADGVRFESLGTVSGAGNSDVLRRYEYVDAHPVPGINYYRLKQTDYDGKFTYSDVVTVDFRPEGTVSIAPAPVRDLMTIRLMPAEKDGAMVIYDASGRVLASRTIEAGTDVMETNVSHFPHGMYFIRVQYGNEVRTLRFFKE